MNVNDPLRDVHAICALLHQARTHQARLLTAADLTHGGATRATDLGRALDCAQSQADWIRADLNRRELAKALTQTDKRKARYRDREPEREVPK